MTHPRLDACVIDTRRSPYARLAAVPLAHVELHDAFWRPRREANGRLTLRTQRAQLESSGALDNVRRLAEGLERPFRGMYFADSDVYKWLEAVGWHLADHPDDDLRADAERIIDLLEAAQRPDGYLNTYFALERSGERWTNPDLHEMYCAGHLFQGAVAYHRSTGDDRLLGVATRFADHICRTFGDGPDQRIAVDGHEEIELALVELYRTTRDPRYLDQAEFFVTHRGRGLLGRPYGHFPPEYSQDHVPIEALDTVVGHAVRALYYASGVADLCAERHRPLYRTALDRQWRSMTERRSFVNGGVGSRYEGEAFGDDYELPHARAYAETCAAIASVMWNARMLALDGEARYADALEWTLYNAVLPGISLDGHRYFYQNPLSDDGRHRRSEWFGVACCPPNLARTVAALPGYVYGVARDGVWVHTFAASTLRTTLPDGTPVALRQDTRYPWDGDVRITVEAAGRFALHLRVPGWCRSARLRVADSAIAVEPTPGAYHRVEREWREGDTVHLELPMPPRYLEAHRRVAEAAGRAAVARGPLLYCVEAADHRGIDPRDLILPRTPDAFELVDSDLPGAVPALRAPAQVASPDTGPLYREASHGAASVASPTVLTAIPYFAWANRAPGPMQVWIQRGLDAAATR